MNNVFCTLAGALAIYCGAAAAADYPEKPVRLVVGFTAGGSADISARAIAKKLGETLTANIVVDNRGGAGGSIAAQLVAIARPDGYTLLWGTVGALTVTPLIEKDLPYNPQTAFAPVGLALTFCNALITRQDSPVQSIVQLIALAKEKPGALNYGTQGIGSAGYLSGELFKSMTGTRFTHVPYKGASEILTAVVSGELQTSFISVTAAGSLRSRIRVLAVTSLNRDPSLPDVPSMNEAGVKNYDATFWYGLLAPAGTPTAVVNKLNKQLRAALADADAMRPVQAQGLNPAPSSPQEYAARIKADYEKWKKIISGA
ncbi:MAG: tripartite tricarboxylate transporter substrate-binding protein [Burkholderiales bacterium]